MGRIKYPRCEKCGKICEPIGSKGKDIMLFGCRTPEICGWEEYEHQKG